MRSASARGPDEPIALETGATDSGTARSRDIDGRAQAMWGAEAGVPARIGRATMSITRRDALLTTAAGLVLSRRASAEGPIRIGQMAPLTGPGAASAPAHVNGAKLAVDMANAAGGVSGRSLEIVVEDDFSTGPGGVAAFEKLAARDDIVAVIGSVRSVVMHAIAGPAAKAGKPVMFGGTDPALTTLGNPWLFRCQPNDAYSARAMAAYGAGELGKRSWAILHTSDPFGVSGSKALRLSLAEMGAKVATDLVYTNQQGDFAALAEAVKHSGADVLGSYVSFEPDQIAIARQFREAGVRLPWIGSQFIAATAVVREAGPALFGTYGVASFHAESTPEAGAFAERYDRVFGARADFFAAWPYDAATILAHAIGAGGSTEPSAIRSAILAIHGFKGAEGEYAFDARGDGLHGYNIVRNDNGRIAFVRRFDFQD